MTEQLAFDLNDRMEVGDWVEVVARPREGQNIETYYYLQEFTGMKGELIRIDKRKVVSFEVRFPNGSIGIFHEHEIKKTQGGINHEKTIRKAKKSSKRTERKT